MDDGVVRAARRCVSVSTFSRVLRALVYTSATYTHTHAHTHMQTWVYTVLGCVYKNV